MYMYVYMCVLHVHLSVLMFHFMFAGEGTEVPSAEWTRQGHAGAGEWDGGRGGRMGGQPLTPTFTNGGKNGRMLCLGTSSC